MGRRPNVVARITVPATALLLMLAVAALSLMTATENGWAQSSVRPPANATTSTVPQTGAPTQIPGRPPALTEKPSDGKVPGQTLGNRSSSDLWRVLREGERGTVSIPDNKAGQLIRGRRDRLKSEAEIREAMGQRGGDQGLAAIGTRSIHAWIAFRKGPLVTYGAYAMGGMLALLVLFFVIRGRIKIEHGFSGSTIRRFGSIELLGHWLLALSFIVLAITGLNMLYGRTLVQALAGSGIDAKATYAGLAYYGKLVHNYVAFAFMIGLVLIFFNWVRHNLPHPRDLVWLAKGGGLLSKNLHPSAKKFNAGQKIIFWLVLLGGASISLSGIALMFPFETTMFGKTFAFLNTLGFSLPAEVTPIQEMQYQSLWHAIMALVLICVILAHIYIGSIGMQGAIDAVTTGEVDENWAREHHDLWFEEVKAAERTVAVPKGAEVEPAE